MKLVETLHLLAIHLFPPEALHSRLIPLSIFLMKNTNPKLIFLHPYIQKQGNSNRLWLMAFVSCLALAILLTIICTRDSIAASPPTAAIYPLGPDITPLPKIVSTALVHYAAISNDTYRMSAEELRAMSSVIRQCAAACNLLVFGLTGETLLWKALNHNGRTVFVDENRYYAAYFEQQHPELDVYDVQYTTKIADMDLLMSSARDQVRNECRPVQNLLFSDCKLALNDLPNDVYDVEWDVILVDGPRGGWPEAPGRMASIFTAGVLARSRKTSTAKTHVFVHDYYGRVEKACSEEFLCKENMAEINGSLAHFVLERVDESSLMFCQTRSSS